MIVLYVEHDGSAYYTIYTSPDLKTWTFSQEIRAGASGTQRGWLYECPGMEELRIEGEDATRWIIWSADADYYQLGTFDGYVFTPDGEKQRGLHQPGNETLGSGFYAEQSFRAPPDGRCIWMAWFQNPPGNGTLSGAKWSQCLSIPQELSLRRVNGALRLVRHPVAEFAGLRAGEAVPLDQFSGDLAEVSLKCKLTASGSVAFNLRGMTVSYDAATQKLTAGGSSVSWPLREGGELALTVFLDRGCAEIFAQDGLDMLPVQTLPSSAANRSLSVTSSAGVSETEFKAWPLSSIWGEGEKSDSKQKVAKPEAYIPSRFAGEYAQLAYLSSTVGGGQYIKTGVHPSADLTFAGRFQRIKQTQTGSFWVTIFGYFSSASDGLCLWHNPSNQNLMFNRPSLLKTEAIAVGRTYEFETSGASMTVNGVEYASSAAYSCSQTPDLPLFAFYAVSDGGYTTCSSKVRLYSFKIWKGDELVRDFVPARDASGTAGMYDLVTWKFFGNDGTGVFNAGEVVESGRLAKSFALVSETYDGGTLVASLSQRGGAAGEVMMCAGSEYGGDDLSAWAETRSVGAFGEGENALTAVVTDIPSGAVYVRFYSVAEKAWSRTIYLPGTESPRRLRPS